jgi:hypothetical protein
MKFQKYQQKIDFIHLNQLRYYGEWLQVLRDVQKVEPSTSGGWEEECRRLREVCNVYRNLADGPNSLRHLDLTFTGSRETLKWKNKAAEMVVKVKSFSEISRGSNGVS